MKASRILIVTGLGIAAAGIVASGVVREAGADSPAALFSKGDLGGSMLGKGDLGGSMLGVDLL